MTTIFEEQTLTFENVDVGMWACELEGNPFKIADGINYVIEFDGTQYPLTAFKMQQSDGSNAVCVGNGAFFGDEYAQDFPFFIGYAEGDNATVIFAFVEGETHTIAIYQTKVIVENKEITFTKNDTDTTAYGEEEGNAFQLQDGMSYIVQFDDVEYTLTSFIFSPSDGANYIFLGNGSFVGLEQTTESPFLIFFAPAEVVGNETGETAILTTIEGTTHTISIYRDDGTGAEEPEEPEEPDVPEPQEGVVIKDFNGDEQTYSGITAVILKTSDGGTQIFSQGEAVENVPITLDFSNGDMNVKAKDNTLMKSVVIETPEGLVPENIKKDKVVAGIIGTHEGGGGGAPMEISKRSGGYTVSTDGAITVRHDLGVLPDIITVLGEKIDTTNGIVAMTSYANELEKERSQTMTYKPSTSNLQTVYTTASIYDKDDNLFGFITRATPKTFQIGSKDGFKNCQGNYSFTVVGGLVHRKYIDVRLALDGDGNLIISGGVPEIEQFNIYVDGTLAKTVDYIHSDDDDFIVDISDVASEIQEYTISVDGVGSAIEEAYSMAFYEPVTGYVVPLAQGSCGDSVNYKLYGDGTLRIYGMGAMADYSGASGQPWYSRASSITSVIIEDGVTRIGNQSLRQLTSMTKISIADSVTSYGVSAFLGSTALSTITISANVTDINAYAFNECTGLKNAYYEGTLEQWCKINFGGTGANPCFVGNATLYIGGETVVNAVIPESITALNAHVFTNCKTLETLTMQNSVTSIGTRAFYGCTSLQSITIPDSVTSIGTYAFYGCTSLQSIDISNNITAIPNYFAYNCAKLANITIPGSVTSIGSYAFNNCAALTSAILSDNLTSVGEYAFSATAITSIVIPDKVTQILWRAFQNCAKLTSVTIGSAVNLIGDNAFYGCSVLTSATFKDTTTWVRNSSQTSTSGTTISSSYLVSTSTAATYLRSTYVGYWWHKN